MSLKYYIMRKNDIITLADFTEDGAMISYSSHIKNMELAPLAYRSDGQWLKKWWKERSIPLTRDQIGKFLSQKGYSGPEEYLIKNLGLSLTDYYWIKPIDSDITWEDINLYDNAFHTDMLIPQNQNVDDNNIPRYSPNSSLQGDIEKAWTIINGERCLVKGNHSKYSNESINEVIASRIHHDQGYDNYADYKLIKIKGKPYDYGCMSQIFTSNHLELIPAWAICTSEKKDNDVSYYEHFLKVCEKHGININQLRTDLEYQIMVDFIMSGYDRHLNNIAILRDSETLKFIRMAPIFDSGGSMFVDRAFPRSIQELEKMDITGFATKETKMLKLVQDPCVLDIAKLPKPDTIAQMYMKDSQIEENTINNIVKWYQKKIEMCEEYQLGRSIFKRNPGFINPEDRIKDAQKRSKAQKRNAEQTQNLNRNKEEEYR